MWAYTPEGILAADDCLVRSGGIFEGSISLTVTVEVGPMPITLSWHVTMLTDRFPHTSWIIWLMTTVDPTIGVGSCSSVSPSELWGSWPLCRMPAMSANPSRGAHSLPIVSSVKVSTLGLEVASGLESQVVIGEPGADSLGLPLCWSSSAQRWALLQLQWLWLWWWHHSSPRLWGTSPTETAALEWWSVSKPGSPEPYLYLFPLPLQLLPVLQLWLLPQFSLFPQFQPEVSVE